MKKEFEVICKNCGKKFTVIEEETKFPIKGDKYFCCRSCANTRHHSEETKLKISKSLIKYDNINICKVCGKQYKYVYGTDTTKKFCSHKCFNYFQTHFGEFLTDKGRESLHNIGIINILKLGDLKRSKNEIEFCKLCENYFNNVEHNKPMFNGWDADIIINDIKYAILWNGKWHYEQITKSHSVKQVQNRDKIKIEEIKKCNYIPYIIKDMGGYNLNFVKKEFDKFIQYIHGGSLAQD